MHYNFSVLTENMKKVFSISFACIIEIVSTIDFSQIGLKWESIYYYY